MTDKIELLEKSRRVFSELSLTEMTVVFKACAAYGQACPDEDLPQMLAIAAKIFEEPHLIDMAKILNQRRGTCG